ncbi:OmpA family protein [Desulfobacter latus]|uniref:OmpA family protein n=1 Tax=Desulfobacter latus TaxID=2292 RepID=A0A850SZD0_9BACT|nr:OmpA family protein [Desulfobacter latus]NWH05480.1 OmpA family protein [Desulfobacter latus]
MKKMIVIGVVIVLSATLFSCATMQTKQERGTAVGTGTGAAVGAILGQVIGRDTEATLIGAGIGAALGGLTGNQVGRYMDLQEQELRHAMAASESANIRRDQDILRATFKSESYFDFDSSILKPAAYPELSRISDILIKYPHSRIEVAGHTDTKGSEAYNQRLSERRAEAVANQLIHNGVSAQRIMTVGYGESQPISSNDAMNRRVEILIKPVVEGSM